METLINNTPDSPIGIFDSGLGGLSICKEIIDLLPSENIVYLADSKNAPYGEKTHQEIIELSVKNTELLLQLNCKIVVVACNTATTNAIKYLRNNYKTPFIGIEPAIKPAALHSTTNKIGVLATKGTLSSELFANTSKQFRKDVEFIELEGKGLVPLIEEGRIDETKKLLEKYLQEMMDSGVDKIVLGCSHYPFLIPIMNQIIPSNVQIIDSGEAVARQTHNILKGLNLLNEKSNSFRDFYTNLNTIVLNEFLKKQSIPHSSIQFKDF